MKKIIQYNPAPVQLSPQMKISAVENIVYGINKPFARNALANISQKTKQDYKKYAKLYFTFTKNPEIAVPRKSIKTIVEQVKTAKTLSTLQKHATAIRYTALIELEEELEVFANYAYSQSWEKLCKIYHSIRFQRLMFLGNFFPADYKQNWKALRSRRSKRSSLKNLAKNWREKFANYIAENKFRSQYSIPTLISLVTGLRPSELELGVQIDRIQNNLMVTIKGAKITQHSGQPNRQFILADHLATDLIKEYMEREANQSQLLVKVASGAAVSKYMVRLGKMLCKNHKDNISMYTARHAMASDCKKAVQMGADPLLTSKVLGHRINTTARTYGHYSQSSGGGVAPSSAEVTYNVRIKQSNRPIQRKSKNMKP